MWADRLRRDEGSALMLMPAGVLIVIILGALAVDSAILFLGERELADLTAAAANDAATAALDADAFYECGRLGLDEDRAQSLAHAVSAARTSDAVTLTDLAAEVDNTTTPPEITVHATGTVRLVFTPAVPGSSRTRTISAQSTAVPRSSGDDPAATC